MQPLWIKKTKWLNWKGHLLLGTTSFQEAMALPIAIFFQFREPIYKEIPKNLAQEIFSKLLALRRT
jgi:hypothetical protein